MPILKSITIISVALALIMSIGCGREKTAPSATAEETAEAIVTIRSPADLEKTVSQGVVLVDFWATWCPPCRIMNPILAEVARERAGSLVVAKVDVDQNRELSEQFKIEAIPTLILFKNGTPIASKVGALSKNDLLAWIDANAGG